MFETPAIHLINQKLRVQIYSFFSLNEAFRIFPKLSNQERINAQLLKNINSNSKNSAKFYISFNERANLMINMKYLQNFSNHYVLQQNPNQDMNTTQYFNFFLETFPMKRMADIQISVIIKENSQSHSFDSIEILENYTKQKLKKFQLTLSDFTYEKQVKVQKYLLESQELHIYRSIMAHKLIPKFKEYETAIETNSQNQQALRTEIFTPDQANNLQSTRIVFQDSALFDPQLIGNMVLMKSIKIINTCFHKYCIEQLMQFQTIEKIKQIHQSSPKSNDLTLHQIDLQSIKYELSYEQIVNFKSLKSLTIQFNDLERFKQLKSQLIANYSANFKIKIIIGYKTHIKQILENFFFPSNFEVQIVAPHFSIFEAKYQQFQDIQNTHMKSFFEILTEEIQKLKSYEFQQIKYQDLPKSVQKSLLALNVYKNTEDQSGSELSIKLYVCSYLQMKAIIGVF